MVGRAGSTTGTVYADVTLTRSKVKVDLDPIQGQGQGHGAFELTKISKAVHTCWRR